MTSTHDNFQPVDWANDHPDVAPEDRFDMTEGPSRGGVETSQSPNFPVLVHVDGYAGPGEGLSMSIHAAKQLRDDLTAVLDQLED